MVQYPVTIKSTAQGNSDMQETWSSTGGSFGPLEISIPTEFDGPNTSYSPEDLFAMALVNCYTATFKVIASKSHLAFDSITGNCSIDIDRDRNGGQGQVRVVNVAFKFTVIGAEDEAKTLRLMEQVSRGCILINSIQAKPNFEFSVETANQH